MNTMCKKYQVNFLLLTTVTSKFLSTDKAIGMILIRTLPTPQWIYYWCPDGSLSDSHFSWNLVFDFGMMMLWSKTWGFHFFNDSLKKIHVVRRVLMSIMPIALSVERNFDVTVVVSYSWNNTQKHKHIRRNPNQLCHLVSQNWL
jgi:hypothetical protein